jgi:hypothetical protein
MAVAANINIVDIVNLCYNSFTGYISMDLTNLLNWVIIFHNRGKAWQFSITEVRLGTICSFL